MNIWMNILRVKRKSTIRVFCVAILAPVSAQLIQTSDWDQNSGVGLVFGLSEKTNPKSEVTHCHWCRFLLWLIIFSSHNFMTNMFISTPCKVAKYDTVLGPVLRRVCVCRHNNEKMRNWWNLEWYMSLTVFLTMIRSCWHVTNLDFWRRELF